MARNMSSTVGSQTTGSWLPLAHKKTPFNVGIGLTVTSGASLTCKVQHTFDDPNVVVPCTITRSTTTATLTLANHGVSGTSDSVVVQGAGAPFDGTYAIAGITDANTITYTVANSGATASAPSAAVAVVRVFDHSSMTGLTANTDGNYAFPVKAVRLNVTAYTSGKATLNVIQGD